MSEPRSFFDVVVECAMNAELVANYDRLYQAHFGRIVKRDPMAALIDKATGFERDECLKFAAFVWDCVWTRLPEEAFEPVASAGGGEP